MGEVSEGGFGQVAAFAVLPLFVLLEQDGADQAGDGLPVGEDLHDVGAALDLAVEALDGVVGPDLGPVLFGEGRKRGAALSGGAGQDRLDRGADTGVGVAGDQHDPLGAWSVVTLSPRWRRDRRKGVQKSVVSASPRAMPRISRRPWAETPVATTGAWQTTRWPRRTSR